MIKYSFYEYVTRFNTENINWFKIVFGSEIYLLTDELNQLDILNKLNSPLDIVKLNTFKIVFKEYEEFLNAYAENIGR